MLASVRSIGFSSVVYVGNRLFREFLFLAVLLKFKITTQTIFGCAHGPRCLWGKIILKKQGNKCKSIILFSGGSRIFLGGASTSKADMLTYFFGRKLHKNERIWTPGGGARPWRPLISATVISGHKNIVLIHRQGRHASGKSQQKRNFLQVRE